MTATWCPEISADPAVVYVDDAHDKFMRLGSDTYKWAVQNAEQLADVPLTPYQFDVGFNYANPQATFNRPVRPNLDTSALEFRDPGIVVGEAPGFDAHTVSFDDAPALEATAPTLAFGPPPASPNIALPVEPSDAIAITMPVPPDYVLPEVPVFDALQLPSTPTVVIPEFVADRPQFVDPPFNESWSFTPEAYTGTLVDTLVSTLKPMIVGSPALPAMIEQAMFERGRSRIEVEARRNVEQAFSEFAARGFSEPQGMLAGRVSEIRQAAQDSVMGASRDVTIRHFELAYEQQRFAITQGAALEGTLIQLHLEQQRYLLEAARFQMDAAVAVVNYRIQIFNAQLQAYQTDSQVYRDRIQAELSKVEVFRAQLEGERLRGELNVQRAQLYETQLRAVTTAVDVYKTQVDTVRVQADINMQGIEKYKAQLQAYNQRWGAYVSEWQGYSASVEGESKRVDIYRAMVDANAKRVDAWATSNNLKMEGERLRIQQHTVDVSAWQTKIERLRAMLQAEQARLAAVATSTDAQARLYTADASVESSASADADRSFELGLSAENARVNTQLKVAEAKISQLQFLTTQMAEIKKAVAQVSAQLAASTMSAVNYGASVSSSRSKTSSCSSSFSFQGEIGDA